LVGKARVKSGAVIEGFDVVEDGSTSPGAVVHALTFLRNEAPEQFAKVGASITV
jgi:hypothetical protein